MVRVENRKRFGVTLRLILPICSQREAWLPEPGVLAHGSFVQRPDQVDDLRLVEDWVAVGEAGGHESVAA